MRIVDVCAFYTPAGGGVRTYIDAKLRQAHRLGHEMIVIAPGHEDAVEQRAPGAFLVTLRSPELPVDRRYRYFDDEAAVHRALDHWRPDHVEASSPWSSATMVGRWNGGATRSLVMHADPLAAYAYRWLGSIASVATIDRLCGRFWRHLRGLGRMFDTIVCANPGLTERLRNGGVTGVETIPLGVEAGRFSPRLRSPALRGTMLRSLDLPNDAILLVALGRLSAEKQWDVVIRAVTAAARDRPLGLVLIGDGPQRSRLERLAQRSRHVQVRRPIADRARLAVLLASADALVHGCSAETFCLAGAEARASGIPLIVPDEGAAAGHFLPAAGTQYRAGDEGALTAAIGRFAGRGIELQRVAACRGSRVRTVDEHFAELFARYTALSDDNRSSMTDVLQVPLARSPQLRARS